MSKWFLKFRHSQSPRLRIFCFPYAGGTGMVFKGWEKQLPEDVDVFAIQAPGRAERYREKPISNLATKVAFLYREITPYIDIPHIFIGHSNGALTAFELARKIQANGNRKPRHIVISARRAPHLENNFPRFSDLHYEEMIKILGTYSKTPPKILHDRGMMEAFIPMLRADFGLADEHEFCTEVKLNASASLFSGKLDLISPKADVLAWERHIAGEVDYIEFDTGHFFIDEEREKYIAALNKIIKKHG